MSNLDYQEQMKSNVERLKFKEQALGRNLRQPYSSTNSGTRKLMHSIHQTHSFAIINSEKANNETGYEVKFGDYSSSLLFYDDPINALYKIPKFSFNPNHHYFLIVQNINTGELDIIERISYKHTTESYCYLYNNSYLDSLNMGDRINPNRVIRSSLAYDEYGNRKDGRNVLTGYIATDKNMEDSIIISDEEALMFDAPLIHNTTYIMNENDIPLNLYGNENIYKIFPDIGERIQGGVLCSFRKEKKDEILFSQDFNRLRDYTISDENITTNGVVVDINIRCNNPERLSNNEYYSQLYSYYKEQMNFASALVSTVTKMKDCRMSYKLEKLYGISKRVLREDQYLEGKPFSNVKLEINVLEELPLSVGDKLANRFGGKGVISEIRPKELMPKVISTGEHLGIIFNQSTMYNRENPGQNFESSINHISCAIVTFIKSGVISYREAAELIQEFYDIYSKPLGDAFRRYIKGKDDYEINFYVECICEKGCIDTSSKPISEPMTIDKLRELYDAFPFVGQDRIEVPVMGSNGSYRFIEARRKIVAGKVYMYRLKQFAEEKFSATSLSSTNIRNENAKSKAAREFREPYPNTPIKFGSMESDDMAHMGIEYVVTNVMIHSLSPQARRLVEQMYTGDPFNIDIKLDGTSSNRSAEIFNTYLKTCGLRLKFTKVRKVKRPAFLFDPITYENSPEEVLHQAIRDVVNDVYSDEADKIPVDIANPKLKKPIKFLPIRFVEEKKDIVVEEEINPFNNFK